MFTLLFRIFVWYTLGMYVSILNVEVMYSLLSSVKIHDKKNTYDEIKCQNFWVPLHLYIENSHYTK